MTDKESNLLCRAHAALDKLEERLESKPNSTGPESGIRARELLLAIGHSHELLIGDSKSQYVLIELSRGVWERIQEEVNGS